ncbi:hypothetical protein DFH07DRAFT_1004431 [Mycena maculata]|uniref:Acetyl-CoA synthetase-like protein n=1 Tax=Mycena maculata TaxID=230809 RepID=A0AAD7JTK0_9AGAR|nr:hypothetical protein DFH07DRAFT_1004431 [Mycena maculata]
MIYSGPTVAPIPELDLLSFLFDSSLTLAEETTVIHAEASNPPNAITKALARRLTRRIAHTLRTRFDIGENGNGKDIVVVMSVGQIMLPILFYGILAAGGVASLASPSFKEDELARQMKHGSAKLCISCPASQATLSSAARLCGLSLDRCLVLDSSSQWRLRMLANPSAPNIVGESELDWERITTRDELENSVICLLYSSGPTGPPKGVKLSHTNMVAEAYITGVRLREHWRSEGKWDYRTLAHLPTAHVAGVQGCFVIPFYNGGTTYWMPKFDFADFLAFNRSLAITTFFSVPPIFLLVTKSPLVKDHFHTLKAATSGAAPLAKGTTNQRSVTGGDVNIKDLSGSVGPLLPHCRLRIVDESGNDCPLNTPGEVLVQGPIVTKGYYNNPEANAEAFKDGYFCTGDIGFFQGDRLHIVDREKELIQTKGLQVAPAELEALLISHPKILDAEVIGVYDEQECTEVPRAYVVPDKAVISAKDIQAFVKSRLANYKQLRGGVEFVAAIPKSPSGKILRKDLRVMATAPKAVAKL